MYLGLFYFFPKNSFFKNFSKITMYLKNKLNRIDPSIDLKYRENTDHSSVSP